MGLDPASWALIASLAGTGVSKAADAHALRKQDRLTAQGIRKQGQRQQEAAARVNEEVAARGRSRPADTGLKADFLNQLRRGQAAAGPRLPTASQAYAAKLSDANSTLGDFGSQLAGQTAEIDSAGRQRLLEDISGAKASAAVGDVQRRAASDDFLNQLRIKRVQPNPWVKLGAGLLQNSAGALAGRAGAGGGGAPLGSMDNLSTADLFDYVHPRKFDPTMTAAQGFA